MEVFQYEPIIHDEHGFRIVRLFHGTGSDIEVEIIHASFDESDLMEYEAVSYVWGSPELTSSIIVGGKRLNVTQNLELVLRDLRLPKNDRYLWIDGICINQEKDKERNHQVRQMGTIYQRAELVLFHLGRSNSSTLLLQKTFEIYQEQHKLRPEMTFESLWVFIEPLITFRNRDFEAVIRQALETILAAPWFRRIWIIQEVANARRALLHWGPASLPVALFIHLIKYFNIKTDHRQSAILGMMPQRRRSKSQWSSQQDLYHLLKDFRGAEASQIHDKIFALVGMCADGKGRGTLTADYSKDLDLVIREAIAYMGFCNAGDIDVGFCSMSQLINGVDSLMEHLLVHLAENERLDGLESLLLNRGDELIFTDRIIRKAIALASYDVTRLLLLHARKRLPFTFDRVEAFVPLTLELTLLWKTILCREIDLVKHLLVDGADVNAIGPAGLSPMGWAAMEGEEDIVKILLVLHADVEAGFCTPLSLAAKHGKFRIAQMLLDHGANIDSRDDRGRTPLSLAASTGFEAILSGGRSEAGIRTIDNLRTQSQIHKSSVEVIQEQFMTILREKLWPSYRLCTEPTTWCPITLSRKNGDSYQDDVSQFRPDFELSDNSRAYTDIVGLLLQRGADVHSKDMLGLTPLWWAVNWGHLPAVKKLLQNNAFIEDGGTLRMTPLSWAIWNDHQHVVQVLLDNRASVNAIDLIGGYPARETDTLFWAICSGNEHQLRQLLNHGLDVADHAAIEVAVAEGHVEIVRLLISRNPALATQGAVSAAFQAILASEERVIDAMLGNGADTEILYKNNWTPLTLAAEKGCFAVVQQLLDQEVDPNVMDGEGRTALMVAASLGSLDIVRILIGKDANVNAQFKNGRSILQQAATNGHVAVVGLLLRYGADIEANNNIGTPLILASLKGHSAIVSLLLRHNANVHARNDSGETALLVAAKYNYGWGVDEKLAVTHLLLTHGADIDARSGFGYTPIILASRAGYTNLVKLLLSANADVDTRDFEGHSALDWSMIRGHREIEQMLREKHGDRVLEVPGNVDELSN